jgi:hypothetical protein
MGIGSEARVNLPNTQAAACARDCLIPSTAAVRRDEFAAREVYLSVIYGMKQLMVDQRGSR